MKAENYEVKGTEELHNELEEKKKLMGIKKKLEKIIEPVLCNRIKLIGDNEQTYKKSF